MELGACLVRGYSSNTSRQHDEEQGFQLSMEFCRDLVRFSASVVEDNACCQ